MPVCVAVFMCINLHGLTSVLFYIDCLLQNQGVCLVMEGPHLRVSETASTTLQHQQTAVIIDLMTNVLTEEKLMIFSDRG